MPFPIIKAEAGHVSRHVVGKYKSLPLNTGHGIRLNQHVTFLLKLRQICEECRNTVGYKRLCQRIHGVFHGNMYHINNNVVFVC